MKSPYKKSLFANLKSLFSEKLHCNNQYFLPFLKFLTTEKNYYHKFQTTITTTQEL